MGCGGEGSVSGDGWKEGWWGRGDQGMRKGRWRKDGDG